MINVVIILSTLVLSFVLIYLMMTDRDTEVSISGPTSQTQKGGEEITSKITENAKNIQTAPPEPEDKGTCETKGDWTMEGECAPNGTVKFTQTYKESKPGACSPGEKVQTKPCCYQKGDWKDISECQTNGMKKQEQTIVNCGNEFKTQTVPCCYQKGDWKDVSECQPNGKKNQEQTTVNCDDKFKARAIDCEYIGDWIKVGECQGDGRQHFSRDVANSNAAKTKTEPCCYEHGNWVKEGGCIYPVPRREMEKRHYESIQKYKQTVVGSACTNLNKYKTKPCWICHKTKNIQGSMTRKDGTKFYFPYTQHYFKESDNRC
jgi:hypothetical protein